MKKIYWTYCPENLGREVGTALAIGFDENENYVCTLKEGMYSYNFYYGWSEGKDKCFSVSHLDKKLAKYTNILERKLNKGKISATDRSVLKLEKLCQMAEKNIFK